MAWPRWLRFGPGLILALMAIVIIWPRLPRVSDPAPAIERTVLEPNPVPPPGAPDPAWLLQQREALRLSPAQVRKLDALRTRWERDTGALQESLARATAEFDRSMAVKGGRSITLPELQERAAPVTELSRQLLEARRAWWSEAGAVLTRAQRGQAEQAWRERLSRKP